MTIDETQRIDWAVDYDLFDEVFVTDPGPGVGRPA